MTYFHNKLRAGLTRIAACSALLATVFSGTAAAGIDGISGTSFALAAREGYIQVADGGSIYMWGYADGNGLMQLPGPTLIVNEGEEVTITLTNDLPAAAGNVSLVIPGVELSATGGVPGALTREAVSGASVTYTFTMNEPGTYQYHSGTRPDLQVEMGLYGAIVVRPTGAVPACGTPDYADALFAGAAYNHADTCYDREYLFLLSEIDEQVHQAAEDQATGPGPIDVGTGVFHSDYWLLNGRAGPDTMALTGTMPLPHQPYNSLPRMHPGERLLLRVVGVGREMHPFHTHGNHVRVLAKDGNLITSAADSTKLAGPLLFTIPSVPGGTFDAIFEWTGKDLGWDIYGHAATDPLAPNEYEPDHGRPIPVELPALSSLAFGGFYSGSPFLGNLGALPVGEGGLNPNSGFAYMWHSHTERELVNNDVFPGGMMTMLIVEAPAAVIKE
jgi:FtsP/CotA-like multicopper oxidase with cupredoxin domain